MDSSRSPGLSGLKRRLTLITKQPSLRSFPRQAAASLRIDRRESINGRCTLKAALNVALGRQTATGRVLPIASAWHSGGPCRLHEAVIGQDETVDAPGRIVDNLYGEINK